MNSILCIVNPVSGLKKSVKSYHSIENKIKEAGFSPELFITEYSGHAMDFLSKIKPNQFNRVFIFGGDGTVNEGTTKVRIDVIKLGDNKYYK